MHAPRMRPASFRKLTLISVFCYALLILSGGAVRLTGSGLGCPDWPTCYQHQAVAALSFHPIVEFLNRLVTVAVTVISIGVFLGALCRQPRRKDLTWLASSLVGGIIAQIILGGIVVLFKLNPYLVALHFLLTLVILRLAFELWHRAGFVHAPPRQSLHGPVAWLTYVLLATLSVLVIFGTVVTGSGPHAGAPGTKRIALAFETAADIHSAIALFLIGLTFGMLFLLYQANMRPSLQKKARLLLESLAIQGVIGYSQYFLHDPAYIVELHLLGVTVIWCVATLFSLDMWYPARPLLPMNADADPSASSATITELASRVGSN